MPLARRRVPDAAALKALAHPARLALLAALVAEGPLTASQAAARVDESPSNCSWHLRKLAEHGFVREARGGRGRRRPWQAVAEGLEWDDGAEDQTGRDHAADPVSRLAAEALTDLVVERELQRLRAARASRDAEPQAWREATGLDHAQVWLTAAEALELRTELREVMTRHTARATAPLQRPDGARLVSLVGWLVPSGPHRVATAGVAARPRPAADPTGESVSEDPTASAAARRSPEP